MRAAAEQRQEGAHRSPGPQGVVLERRAHLVEVGVRDPLPGVVEGGGVVDQGVEPAELLVGSGAGPFDVLGAGDIQLPGEHPSPIAGDGGRRAAALLHVARPEHHGIPTPGELAAHLEADAAIPAGDQRD